MVFKKAVVCSDQHFGRNSNNPVSNQDNLEFFEWFIEEAKTWGAETAILCGDFFDNRSTVHIGTMDYAVKALEMLGESFENVYALAGNHDLFYRNTRDVSSIVFAKHFPNIHTIFSPLTMGEGKESVTFLPWLVGDEHKKLKNMKSRYVFGHLELSGFLMNAKVAMPTHPGSLCSDDFPNFEYVFSGHFHFRQAEKNIVYIGNIMPFNFADVDDTERGMMFLEWGKEPFFKAWPNQPLFSTMLLSDMLDHPNRLKPKMTTRVTMDIDISYEEAQLIKDTFMRDYGLRRMELIHPSKGHANVSGFTANVVFQSIDQIVIENLSAVEGKGLDSNKLIDIYKHLPELDL